MVTDLPFEKEVNGVGKSEKYSGSQQKTARVMAQRAERKSANTCDIFWNASTGSLVPLIHIYFTGKSEKSNYDTHHVRANLSAKKSHQKADGPTSWHPPSGRIGSSSASHLQPRSRKIVSTAALVDNFTTTL